MVILLFFLIEKPVEPEPSISLKIQKTPVEFDEIKFFTIMGIRFYQFTLSGQQGDVCQFKPSCSRFAYSAIHKYGAFWGFLLATDRLQRCNPFAFHYAGKFYEIGYVQGRGIKILEKPEDVWKYR